MRVLQPVLAFCPPPSRNKKETWKKSYTRNCLKFHRIEIALLRLLTFQNWRPFFVGRKMSKGPLILKSQDPLSMRAALAIWYLSFPLIQRHRLMVFESKVRRKTFGRKRDEVTHTTGKNYTVSNFYNLHCSFGILLVVLVTILVQVRPRRFGLLHGHYVPSTLNKLCSYPPNRPYGALKRESVLTCFGLDMAPKRRGTHFLRYCTVARGRS